LLSVRIKCEIFAAKDVLVSKGIEFKNREDKEKQFKEI